MRILQVIHQFFPDRVGGTEVYTQSLARALIARNHQVAVFHRAPGRSGLTRAEWEGVLTYRACAGPMTPWPAFRATFGEPGLERAFSETLDDFRPDVIHVQHLMGLPVSLVAQARRRQLPLALTLHDYWFICANAQLVTNDDQRICQGPRHGGVNCARCALARAGAPFLFPCAPMLMPLFFMRSRLLRCVLDQMALIIAPSRFLQERMVAWGIAPERLLYLPHGIDVSGARPRSPRAVGSRHFAYIGGLAFQKGVHVLIEAFNDLDRDATLEIYGDPTQFPQYCQQLSAMAHSPQITFGGRLDRAGVWRVLSEIDALLVPSVWYENAPVVIQEALVAQVPVIASGLGALSEWVQDGVNGLLVPPGSAAAWRLALQRLVDEPNLLSHLQANIHPPMMLAEHVSRIEALYHKLVDRNLRS
jgi:glycosyltransferase involved in cell wall biosynthesis